jgi:hypothetical protein
MTLRSRSAATAIAGRPVPLLRARWEDAARPGQPGSRYAHSLDTPRQFTLENCRLPLALPQSSGGLRNSHVFAEATFQHNVAPRNIKKHPDCEEAVDDWTSLWRAEEILKSPTYGQGEKTQVATDTFVGPAKANPSGPGTTLCGIAHYSERASFSASLVQREPPHFVGPLRPIDG